MPFIVETGAHHPGIKLYVTEIKDGSRRKRFEMLGIRDEAFQFFSRAEAENAAARFSSMYGLIVVETQKETPP